MWTGSMSESPSQNFFVFLVVHVLNASPLRPWTATTLVKSQHFIRVFVRISTLSDLTVIQPLPSHLFSRDYLPEVFSWTAHRFTPLQQPPRLLATGRTKQQTRVRGPRVYSAKWYVGLEYGCFFAEYILHSVKE